MDNKVDRGRRKASLTLTSATVHVHGWELCDLVLGQEGGFERCANENRQKQTEHKLPVAGQMEQAGLR